MAPLSSIHSSTVHQDEQNVRHNEKSDDLTDKDYSPPFKRRQRTRMNLKHQLALYIELRQTTLSKLARASGVPKTTIHSWITNGKVGKMEQIKAVADALEVSLDHLVFGSGQDEESAKITELDALLGDTWISGLFEVKFRRIKR